MSSVEQWKPKDGENCWFVCNGRVLELPWDDYDDNDAHLLREGFVFHTRAEAEASIGKVPEWSTPVSQLEGRKDDAEEVSWPEDDEGFPVEYDDWYWTATADFTGVERRKWEGIGDSLWDKELGLVFLTRPEAEAALAALRATGFFDGKWQPTKDGEKYWAIDGEEGRVYHGLWSQYEETAALFKRGRVFPSKEEAEAALAEIKSQKEQDSEPAVGVRWKPEFGDAYWTISPNDSVYSLSAICWNDDLYDCRQFAAGLVFRTKDEAQAALAKMTASTETPVIGGQDHDLLWVEEAGSAPEAQPEGRKDDPDKGKPPVTAASVLNAAAQHMQDRAATYDKPKGERSMGATVAAFNAITGAEMTEAQGWLFMAVLKQVRLFQRPGYHADSAEDAAAYMALMAEAKAKEIK